MTDTGPRELDRRALLLGLGGLAASLATEPSAAQTLPPGLKLPPLPALWNHVPRIPLWPAGPPSGGFAARPVPAGMPPIFVRNIASPELRIFRPARPNGRALLSIPGGAYTFASILNEGVDVATRFTAKGYTVFVLLYRLPDEGWIDRADVALEDAQRAVRTIRALAPRYRLDPERIGVIGFSAGGHLAASLATGFDERLHAPRDAADRLGARPAAVGLIYPVISHEPGIGHAESSLRLLGPAPTPAQIARRSPALHVGAATPPVFLVHAIDDGAVPVRNSLIMIDALRAAGRPCEAHLFQEGGHGFGIGKPDQPAHLWPDLFAMWFERQT